MKFGDSAGAESTGRGRPSSILAESRRFGSQPASCVMSRAGNRTEYNKHAHGNPPRQSLLGCSLNTSSKSDDSFGLVDWEGNWPLADSWARARCVDADTPHTPVSSNPRPAFRGSFRLATARHLHTSLTWHSLGPTPTINGQNGIIRYDFGVTHDDSSGQGRR